MDLMNSLLDTAMLSKPLSQAEGASLSSTLGGAADLEVYSRSIVASDGVIYFLGRRAGTKRLGLLYQGISAKTARFIGQEREVDLGGPLRLRLCPADHLNAVALRSSLSFTAPRTLGMAKSIGCGDRLGLATPGHVRALREAMAHREAHQIAPVFAQQSIREMVRTERTPDDVMDDATWGVFQEGWRDGFGADADHLKTIADVDRCVEAGYTLYTVDPGDQVDNAAASDAAGILCQKVTALPWDVLESSPQELRATYLDKVFDLNGEVVLRFSDEVLLRAAAKYGRAVAHTVAMYRHLVQRMSAQGSDAEFELEVSVDETETPTTPEEHFFVAQELGRLGVRWVSLAPRFVGRFEKGVDYIGDLAAFEADLIRHMAVIRALEPYKLSIHSGSDKFSIYPIAARIAGDLVHLKTAGTSYLEALRTIAHVDRPLFREILAFAEERYAVDKATYHVSADPRRFPDPTGLAGDQLADTLDVFDCRQLLHVTFGSVLTERDGGGSHRFRDRLLAVLSAEEEAYSTLLESHIGRHLAPFVE